ncbi:MAG: hypothetical protein HQK49_13185 [Oligoflexia bacterium]|nr:hypothetical protein [Oligoflexia bacterium]
MKNKVLFLLIIINLILIAAITYILSMEDNLWIKGPIYQEIIDDKDLVADILPPPQYLVESYLVVLQTLRERDPVKLKNLILKGDKLKDEYFERASYWNKKLVSNVDKDNIRNIYFKNAYISGIDFLSIRDKIFIPAILRGNYQIAEDVVFGNMLIKYEKHRADIDKIIKISTEKNVYDEVKATEHINRFSVLLLFINFLLVISFILIGYMGYNLIVKKINRVTNTTKFEEQEVVECLSSMKSMLETFDNTNKRFEKENALDFNKK